MSSSIELQQECYKVELDNSRAIMGNLYNLLRVKELTDLCLVVNGNEFYCHKLVLSASSDVFQSMLSSRHWSEASQTKFDLYESQDCAEIFGDFLNYLYSGKYTFKLSTALPSLFLADKYLVKSLKQSITEIMMDNLARATQAGYLHSWVRASKTLCCKTLQSHCLDFCKKNFFSFPHLHGNSIGSDVSFLISLLKCSDLVVVNEWTLYLYASAFLLKLLEDRGMSHETDKIVFDVISNIRFGMLNSEELLDLLFCPLVKNYQTFFMERIRDGVAFHRDYEIRMEEVLSRKDGVLQITPRLYTSITHSVPVLIKNYSLLPFYTIKTVSFTPISGPDPYSWTIYVYPKGVIFGKMHLVGTSKYIEEHVLKTVRVTVVCNNPPCPPDDIRVKVAVLIYVQKDDMELIGAVQEKIHYFSEDNQVFNFDDVVPWSDPSYLVGGKKDDLRLYIIVQELSKYR